MTQHVSSLDSLKQLYDENKEEILNDYLSFLRFESVSSEASYKPEVLKCAEWVKGVLDEIGFQTEEWTGIGYPVIFGSYMEAGPDKPTLLFYNHYDVQPVDPVEEWDTPPFEPTVKEGEVYARGAQDNKGQCLYVLATLKALMKRDGKLPVNVKVCIEGEEEHGSVALGFLLKNRKEALKADYLAVVDCGIPNLQTPAVTLGIRGIVCMEVDVQGSSADLHSGSHGGLAFNPLHALTKILAALRDETGSVTVPGFYDGIAPLTDEERSFLSMDFDPEEYHTTTGAHPTGGESSLPHLERVWLRPSLEINGIAGGYAGPGFKTVIPAKATAKLSCRVPPGQSPETLGKAVATYIESLAPEGVQVKATVLPGYGLGARVNPTSNIVKAYAQAYTEVFETPCKYVLEGASIPIAANLARTAEAELVLVGLGLSDDQIHAPNEHFGLGRIEKGFLITARTLEILGS